MKITWQAVEKNSRSTVNLVLGLSMLDKSRKIPTSLIWLPLYMANFTNQLENVKGKTHWW